MTVVVQPTHTPAEQEVSERERRARVLEAAALEIEVRGWARHSIMNACGQVCAVGAIDLVARHARRSSYEIAAALFGTSDSMLLPIWNDAIAESAAEVTFLLRWRAQELLDGL